MKDVQYSSVLYMYMCVECTMVQYSRVGLALGLGVAVTDASRRVREEDLQQFLQHDLRAQYTVLQPAYESNVCVVKIHKLLSLMYCEFCFKTCVHTEKSVCEVAEPKLCERAFVSPSAAWLRLRWL